MKFDFLQWLKICDTGLRFWRLAMNSVREQREVMV